MIYHPLFLCVQTPPLLQISYKKKGGRIYEKLEL